MHRGLVRVGRVVRSVLVAPPFVGALVVVGLAAWSGSRSSVDDADLGDVRRAEAVQSFIEARFGGEITRMKIGIVATAIAIGLIVGLVAEVLVRLRYWRPRADTRGTARRFVEAAFVCLFVHGACVAWSMADSPQLYAARFYARGGLLRTVQIVATDVLGPRGVVLVAVVLAALYVGTRRPRRALVPASALALTLAPPGTAGERPARADGTATAPGTAVAPGTGPKAEAGGARMNVLVLAADSLRADRLDPRVAPTLSRIAEKGARFDRAYVSIPRTFPSWVTILTGRHSHHHGVRSMFPTWEERAKDFDALPARLSAAGYRTGVVSDYAGDIFGRIELGFGRVDTPSFDFRQLIRQRALERETPLLPFLHSQLGRRVFPVMRELNDAADPMLLADDVAGAIHAMKDWPFFLTVFFSTAHFPYAAPAPYYARFTDPSYRGRFKYHKPVGLAGDELAPDAADVKQVQALYDGTVAAIDDAVARVLAALEREGLASSTILVVTADHGEALYDDGHGQGHGDHLFGDQGTHVPLVVYDPRVSHGRRIDRIVRDVDIAPTLYELTGVAPPADLDGASLAGALRGEPLASRVAVAETELWFTEQIPSLPPELRLPYPGIMGLTELDARHNAEIVLRKDMAALTRMARHRMVRDEQWKLVYVPTRKGVKYMLFDTLADPGETRDRADDPIAKEHRTRLEAALWSWMLRDPSMEKKNGFLVPRGAP
ncbi:MAG: sulfatase [Deltaproteobacteria bacterium]|nr:sulfatase [Deltaproteobacteria bacterium]